MTLREQVEEWKQEKASLNSKADELRNHLKAVGVAEQGADDKLVEAFMGDYRVLPRQVRMKVRQAINNELMEKA